MLKKISIILVLFIVGCLPINRRKTIIPPHEIIVGTTLDSLTKTLINVENIDTILVFHKLCIGCNTNDKNMGYLIWKKNARIFVKKVDKYLIYKKNVAFFDIFNYFFLHRDTINKEKFVSPDTYLMHYHFTRIFVKIGNQDVFFVEVPDYFRDIEQNENTYLMRWIRLIESNLFEIERNPSHWQY